MASEKREADTLNDEQQALVPKQQKPSTNVPNFFKPLKIVIVNRRARPDTTNTIPSPHPSSTSPSTMASKKRKADTFVKDMRAVAKNILKKHKPTTNIATTSTVSRKPLKIVIINRREAKGEDVSEVVNGNGTADTAGSNRPRTSFLDLPRELRQSILLLARPWRTAWTDEKEWMAMTLSVLKEVDPRLSEDVKYVGIRWMRLLTDELEDAGYTWESLKKNEESFAHFPRFHEMRIGKPRVGAMAANK